MYNKINDDEKNRYSFVICCIRRIFRKVNIDCSVCQLVVNGLEELDFTNSTVVQLEKYVETIRNVFPSYQTMCDNFIEKWMPYV